MEQPVDLLPAHLAAVRNDVQKLSTLVKEGAQLKDPTSRETPFHAAAKTGSAETLKWMLQNKDELLSVKSAAGGYTAAHQAAVYGHLECLKLILTHDSKRGKKLAAMGDEVGLTVMSLATLQGDKKMVSWLLDNFPETTHIANSNGDQAVHFAAAEGHLEILKLFVKKFGQEIVSREDNRFTKPVFFAAQQGQLNVLHYLIKELGEDAVAKDKDGLTSVHAATQNEMADAVKWLINTVGSKYILDKTIDGATPLHMAAASGNRAILQFFLENLEDPNDVNVKDNINATPAHDAAEYGMMRAMIILLKHGADLTLKDTEHKTPYQLAMEQSHTELAAMIADYQDNGPSVLHMYEKKKSLVSKEKKKKPRTSQQEAEELSTIVQQTSEVIDSYKSKQLKRQESLNKLNEAGAEDNDDDDDDDHNKKQKSRQNAKSPLEENVIEHLIGPKGDPYAVPKKTDYSKHQKVRGRRSHQNSDIEDFISETMSQRSYNRGHHLRGGSLDDDPPYALVNHETASNYSRPSRVKHYRDTDSEISGLTGRSDYLYEGRGHGFYPPGYNPMYPPSLPPPRGKNRTTSASSQHSGSHYQGQMPQPPMGVPPAQFGFNPGMYYGYPQMYPGYMQPGGRGMVAMNPQHQAMMRAYGPPGGGPVFMAHPMQMQRNMRPQKPSRRKSLVAEKKKNKKGSDDVFSPRKQHTDENIGYGPALDFTDNNDVSTKEGDLFHPPAPPISTAGGKAEPSSEVLKFDSNFLMAKPGENDLVRVHAGTALNPSKAGSKPYDGQYDKYIMTDSEEEYEVDDLHRVGFAAEMACILAIGCVAGLRGLTKMKTKKSEKSTRKVSSSDQPSLSSAWDASYTEVVPSKKKGGRRSRRNSISSEVDNTVLTGLTPEEFAGREETERSTWDKANKKKQVKEEEKKKKSANADETQSELITAELHKQSHQSVSKSLGEKLLYDTIGARHSSMLNIASSGVGSRMSLNASSGDEGDDDDFGDAISMVHGGLPSSNVSKRKHHKPGNNDDQPLLATEDTQEKSKKKKGKKDKDKKRKREKREKAKKEAKESSKEEEEEGEVIENGAAVSAVEESEKNKEEGKGQVLENNTEKEEQNEEEKQKEEEKKLEEEERKMEKKLEEEERKKEKKLEDEGRKKEKKLEEERKKKEKKLEEEKKKEKKKVEEDKKKKKEEKMEEEKKKKERKKLEEEERKKKKEEEEKRKKEEKMEEEERKKKEKEKKDKEEKKEKDKNEKKDKDKRRDATKSNVEETNTTSSPPQTPEPSEEKPVKVKKRVFSALKGRGDKGISNTKLEEEKSEKSSRKEKSISVSSWSGVSDTEEINAEKSREDQKSKEQSTKSQTPAEPPQSSSRAKSASKDTTPLAKSAATPGKFSPSQATAAPSFNEVREVENKLHVFDTESEDEEEEAAKTPQNLNPYQQQQSKKEIENSMKNMTSGLKSSQYYGQNKPPQQMTTTSNTHKDVPPMTGDAGMPVDDRDIFGDDGLAELNKALEQLNNLQASLSFF